MSTGSNPRLEAAAKELARLENAHMWEGWEWDGTDEVFRRSYRSKAAKILAAADAISLHTGEERCPFALGGSGPVLLDPEDTCPVCGDLGTFTKENMDRVSRCVHREPPSVLPLAERGEAEVAAAGVPVRGER